MEQDCLFFEGGGMRGKLALSIAVASICALTPVVSLLSIAGARLGCHDDGRHRTRDHGHGRRSDGQGDSTDDLLTLHNELFEESYTDVAGSDQGECVRIEVGVNWECR